MYEQGEASHTGWAGYVCWLRRRPAQASILVDLTWAGILCFGRIRRGWSEGEGAGGIDVDHVAVVLVRRRRRSGADIPCLFPGVSSFLALTSALHRLRRRVPPAPWCCRVSLRGVGNVVGVLLGGDEIPGGVCLLPPSAGRPFRRFQCRPMVCIPLNDGDPLVVKYLSSSKLNIELSYQLFYSLSCTAASSCYPARGSNPSKRARSYTHG